jgi:chromosome segregation ATPase
MTLKEALGSGTPQELSGLIEQNESLGTEAEQLRQQVQSLQGELTERGKLAELIAQRDDELVTTRAEAQRLTEQLRADFAHREQELVLELDNQRSLVEDLRQKIDEAGQKHGDERTQLAEQHHLAQERLASAEVERAELQARIGELQSAHETLKTEHLDALASERARMEADFQSALEAERAQHARQLAEVQALAEENAGLADRLKAEILTLAQSRSAPDNDLQAARAEIEDLRKKLSDIETTKRSMSSLLEGMGIRLH